ncbi:LysR family transcriptional regulator [Maritimibacter sp. DP1N21-5]|uniref:LysR family transcriptional regulator n=1 Tax=Maritimibacter sp. DP1N21-5 TaxID=2836867 RepID=UPI001C481F12|nr:LysR family transcriptional regulator [Maritimibacter sp. DP1N21-5]MBV7409850.1 LysR family transcriptional regulator [Maritimibacter sp. DP1N21-5]
MKQMDWDDLRYVLAVAQEGSLSGAARVLGVNHATVLRRINGFEDGVGMAIFDRTARGYRIAPRRSRILEAMRGVEDAVFGVERAITAARSPLAGVVRVTSTDSLCVSVLPPIIAQIEAQAEGLQVELSSQNIRSDLARLDADIAVRPAPSLPPELTGTVAAQLGLSVYAAPGGGTHWLGFSGTLAEAFSLDRFRDLVGDGPIGATSDSFVVLREMAAAGQGRAILPCILGDGDPRLVRLDGMMAPTKVDIWVASHVDLAEVPRIRAVRDLIVRALDLDRDQLLGPSNG